MKIIARPRKLHLRGYRRSYGILQAASADEPVQAQTVTVSFLPR